MIYVFMEHGDEYDRVHGVCEGPDGAIGEELWKVFNEQLTYVHHVPYVDQWYPEGMNVPVKQEGESVGVFKQRVWQWYGTTNRQREIDIYEKYVDWAASRPGWKKLDYTLMLER